MTQRRTVPSWLTDASRARIAAAGCCSDWYGADSLVDHQTPGTKRFVVALYTS